jgi:hypothetical protein
MEPLQISQSSNRARFAFRPTSGALIILLYCAFTYGLPLILTQFVEFPDLLYREVPNNPAAVLMLIAVLAIFVLLSGMPGRHAATAPSAAPLPFISPALQLTFLVIAFGISLVSYARGYNDWRYGSESLSSAGSPLLLLFALIPALAKFLLFYYLFYDRELTSRNDPSNLARRFLLCATLLLTANGTVHLMYALLAVVFVVFPSTLRGTLFRDAPAPAHEARPKRRSLFKVVLLMAACLAGVAAAYTLGEAIKRTEVSGVLEGFSDPDFASTIVGWLIGRVSSSYYSLLASLHDFAFATRLDIFYDHLMAPVRTFLFRVDYLLMHPFGVERPAEGSLMRINYLEISASGGNEREGTSPGLLAGFLLAMPFPFNFMALLLYLFVAQRFITTLVRGCCGELKLIGMVLYWPFMLTLFESPLDLMLVIDDSVLSFVLLLALYFSVRRRDARSAHSIAPNPAPA